MVVLVFVYGYVLLVGSGAFGPDQLDAILLKVTAYIGVALGYLGWIALSPAANPLRRLVAMATDFGGMSWLMYLSGDAGAPLYPLYLWVTLGNGFRYGVRYLFASAAVAIICFGAVVATAQPWKDHPLLSAGLLLGLVLIPAYAATLIRKLMEAKAQAEAASLAKSRFLAVVSHELRTPLHAIIGMSDSLGDTELDREQRDMLRTVRLSGRSLLSLIDSVLDFSRIEAGKTETAPTETDLHRALGELVTVLRPQAAQKGLRLSLTLDARVPALVRIDWRHTRQILTNLIANAIKFTDSGGVSLRVGCRDGGDGLFLVMEVSDTGIGIPADKLEHVFSPFAQVDASASRSHGGTGLGLSICKQLVQLLGGAIRVRSSVGAGSTFTVTLPVQEAARPEQGQAVAVHALALVHPATAERLAGLCRDVTAVADAQDAASRLAAPARLPRVVVAESAAAVEAMKAAIQDRNLPVILLDGDEPRDLPLLVQGAGEPSPALLANALRACLAFVADEDTGREEEKGAEARPARPLRVLVAEDNPVNVRVLTKILEKAGHQMEVVTTGDALLDAMDDAAFDVVVADVNMPGTSLVDAVKLYRMANLDRPRLPIIALTADATTETREACEEAGVDAFLTKPVIAATLLETMARLAGARDASAPGGVVANIMAHPAFNGPESSALDPAAIEALLELGDHELLRDLSAEFVQDAEGLLATLEEAVRLNEHARFRAASHALRSSAANMGARRITRLCQDTRRIPPHDLPTQGKAFCGRAREELARYRQEILRYLAAESPDARTTRPNGLR